MGSFFASFAARLLVKFIGQSVKFGSMDSAQQVWTFERMRKLKEKRVFPVSQVQPIDSANSVAEAGERASERRKNLPAKVRQQQQQQQVAFSCERLIEVHSSAAAASLPVSLPASQPAGELVIRPS